MSELDRREAVVRDDDNVGAVADAEGVDGAAHAHQVVVAQAERFHRRRRAQPGHVLREIGIVLPEDDERGPASVGGAFRFGQSVFDGDPREVQIALLVDHRRFRFGRHCDLVAR